MHSTSHSFAIEQFQHLPNPYPHDAIRDSFIRSNIVNLDLASPPPPRYNPRTHPLTPPDTPGHSRTTVEYSDDHQSDETPFVNTDLDVFLSVGLVVDGKSLPTRYLVLGGVPTDAPASTLSRVFSRMGDLKGMFVRYQKEKGIVVLSWHDTRHAKKAHRVLSTNVFFGRKEPLSVAFISPFSLIKATGKSQFVNGREGNLTIVATEQSRGGSIDHEPVNLHAAFALFGELSAFLTSQEDGITTYYASYYDAREAATAAKALHERSILGMSIRITEGIPEDEAAYQETERSLALSVDRPVLSRSQPAKMQYSYSSVACRRISTDQLLRATKPSVSSPIAVEAKEQSKPIITPLSPSSTASPDRSNKNRPAIYRTSQRSPDTDKAPSKGTTIFSTGPPRPPRVLRPKRSNISSRSNSPSTNLIPRILPPRLSLSFLTASVNGPINPNATPFTPSVLPFERPHPPISFNPPFFNQPLQGSPTSIRGSIPSLGTGPSTIESGLSTPINTLPSGLSPALSKRSSIDHLSSGYHSRDGSFEKKNLLPPVILESEKVTMPVVMGNERNAVDVTRIEAGLDTRTTVMLKNVPNKMSDADLRKYINEVVPNSFDFVYLRFDFQSSANVGYAFVNFVEVSDLLAFAKARLGVKWNMFCSEKVLQMSYANFQGKEALVEKFKNSCVMEMQDEWVPKIFYSSGPKKGQREPFPPSTNASRSRRSQDQRERGILRTNHGFFNYKPLSHQR